MAGATQSNDHTMSRLAFLIILLAAVAATASAFDEFNPIRLPTDDSGLLLDVLGNTRHALSFARFAHRYGKRYDSAEEIKLRFTIYRQNLKLIRETNRRGLPYTLAVNN